MAIHLDDTDSTQKDVKNADLITRYEFLNKVKRSGRIHADIFSQGQLILNRLPLKLPIHRQRNMFVFLSRMQNANFKLNFNRHSSLSRKSSISPHKVYGYTTKVFKSIIFNIFSKVSNQ